MLPALLLLWLPLSASAQMVNPLPAWAADGASHAFEFRNGGLLHQGRHHRRVGRWAFEAWQHEDRCERGGPGRQRARITLGRDEVRVETTTYKGCSRTRWRTVVHRYSLDKPKDTALCRKVPTLYRRGEQTLMLTDRCDGTLRVALSGVSGEVIASAPRRQGRYGANDRGVQGTRWRLKLRWNPGQAQLKPRGFIRAQGQRRPIRLRGVWDRVKPSQGQSAK